MATLSTATSNFDKMLVTLIQKRLQEELRAPLPHLLPGNFTKAEFVEGTNNTMRFLRVADMEELEGEDAAPSAGTAPWLTEGTPPTEEDLALGYEEFSANQAGRVLKITDKAILQSPIKLIAKAAEKVVRNSLETADRRVARVISAGTNVLYAGAATSRQSVDAADLLVATTLRRAVQTLKSDNVPAFPDGYYRAIINPATVFNFQEDTAVGGWIDAARYAGSMPLLTGEIGRFAGVRFIESSSAKVFANGGTDVSALTITGDATGGAEEDLFTTSAAHGLTAGDTIRFLALTGGTGLTVGTVYYVKEVHSATTFDISATDGGAVVNFTTDVTAATWGTTRDVHSTFLFGPEAYAFGDWGTIETHITPPGGHDDPLHQSALVGWKGYFGAMLVGEGDNSTNASPPRYIRVESASTL